MIRAQRRTHLLVWMLLAPLLALLLVLAVSLRPAEPVADSLPPPLEDAPR